jgi:hypothetical protein
MALKFKSEGATFIGIDMEEIQIDGIDMRVVNVTNTNEVQTFFDDIIQTYGRFDILVNNAGITLDAMTHKMTDDQWNLVVPEIMFQQNEHYLKTAKSLVLENGSHSPITDEPETLINAIKAFL